MQLQLQGATGAADVYASSFDCLGKVSSLLDNPKPTVPLCLYLSHFAQFPVVLCNSFTTGIQELKMCSHADSLILSRADTLHVLGPNEIVGLSSRVWQMIKAEGVVAWAYSCLRLSIEY
jgi:hypothetical protein